MKKHAPRRGALTVLCVAVSLREFCLAEAVSGVGRDGLFPQSVLPLGLGLLRLSLCEASDPSQLPKGRGKG